MTLYTFATLKTVLLLINDLILSEISRILNLKTDYEGKVPVVLVLTEHDDEHEHRPA